MANEITYFDTPYTFINPVRYFKANDPYYYEVDNIPIKQLEETSNFLKDQVDGLLNLKDNVPKVEIDRSGFSELRPYATGNDRKVRVKPGKYTARINNAFDITPLQVVAQVAGYSNNEPGYWTANEWQFDTIEGSVVKATLDQFQLGLFGAAYMMNGLYERSFVYPVGDEDGIDLPANPFKFIGGQGAITSPGYDYGQWGNTWMFAPFPNYTGIQPSYDVDAGQKVSGPAQIVKSVAKNQGRMEAVFIQRWRGAIRTSVVDVPYELDIGIPDYDEDDFFYFDASGTQQPITSNQRIDLLFIYSKAIDETATTLNKFDINGNPVQITRAELGIVKGAGVGLSRRLATTANPSNLPGMARDLVDIRTPEGEPLMFAHPGDENGTTVGFSTSAGVIKGSFPSPDDLMNLAPVLSENLELNSLPLIGQSILPIAYIRVQKPTGGGPINALVTEENIIDIRPFFRTTELAYNERAGIAAATPQISIANPVVSEAHLEGMRQEMITPIDARLNTLEALSHPEPDPDPNRSCRAIAAGHVLGGFWGPEGALMRHARLNTGNGVLETTMSNFADLIETDFGYKSGSIPYWPDWDPATWRTEGPFTDTKICDSINIGLPWAVEPGGPAGFVKYAPPWINTYVAGSTIQSLINAYGGNTTGMFNWDSNPYARPFWVNPEGFANGALNKRFIQINYVSKKIKLDLLATPWVTDYHVNTNLLHCLPLSDTPPNMGGGHPADSHTARTTSHVWVQKYSDFFVINVSWAGRNIHPESLTEGAGKNAPWADRNNPERFAGFVHPHMRKPSTGNWQNTAVHAVGASLGVGETERNTNFETMVNTGAAGQGVADPDYMNTVSPLVYPSVQWEVIGIGSGFLDKSLGTGGTKMHVTDPTIICI